MQIPALHKLFQQYPAIQTDTRKVKPGDLFFALKGPNFNGNLFAADALDKGAAFAITDDPSLEKNDRIITVDDSLSALQELAKYHRQQFTGAFGGNDIPFIAITGSNGKTTSKELAHAVLSAKYKTYTTEGNLNNQIGIPLTILKIRKDAEIAIIEMGANHQKEIASYCSYTLPTHGIITNCGKAHMEGFGGIEGIRKGKGELFDYLRQSGGTAFIMNDYDYLVSMSKGISEVVTYGTSEAYVSGIVKDSRTILQVAVNTSTGTELIQTHLVGEYNLPNILLAVTLGRYFKVPESDILHALENYVPSNSRSQLLKFNGNDIVLDAYNANPTSMKAAIENFEKMTGTQKVLMLGGMMELGEHSVAEHQQIVDLINSYSWHKVVFVGGDFSKTVHDYTYFDNSLQGKEWFQAQQFNNTAILIKGSRSMQMERVLE